MRNITTKVFLLLSTVFSAGCAAAPQTARSQTTAATPVSAQPATPTPLARTQGSTEVAAAASRATFTFTINEQLPPFTFELFGKNGHTPDLGPIEHIRVQRAGDTQSVQTLDVPEAVELPTDVPYFAAIDINFDGYADIKLLGAQGGGYATVNASYQFWLFDQGQQKFIYSKELSELFNPEPDTERKQIKTYWRDGPANYRSERYSFVAGQLLLVEKVEWRWLRQTEKFLKTTSRLHAGKLAVVSRELTADANL